MIVAAPQPVSIRNSTEHRFTSFDGQELFYRAWLPSGARAKGAVILLHRGHEHSARWQDTVDGLDLQDTPMFAWDQRGHGHSPGDRGYATDVATVVRDLDLFVKHVCTTYGVPIQEVVVLAHSVGAVVGTAWVHDYAPKIRALILATPAFQVRLYVPFAIPGLRLLEAVFGAGYVRSYIKARMITHDPVEAEKYTNDPMVFPQISINMLLDLYDTGQRLAADAGAIHVPVMMIEAGSDWVVDRKIQRRFFDGLSSETKRWETMDGFYHAVFHETGRADLWAKIRAFIVDPEVKAVNPVRYLDADKRGHTYEEFERLRRNGPIWFKILQWLMFTIGWISRGITIGIKRGFDSGAMLDYVYKNTAHGFTFIGRMVDRGYLDAIGWRGIRVRKKNLEDLLTGTIEQVHASGKPVRILDIATGGGRYVLDTMAAIEHIPVSAHLRDYKQNNIDAVKKLAAEMGLKNVTAERGDAFNEEALAAITPKPTIGIISGLFELFPLNRWLTRSLNGMFQAIEPGGYLIYTCQPWHPQLELIARTLGNRENQPWVMRRRTQAEMDALVEAAGFVKIDQRIDTWGIFTVSVAKRP